MVSTVNFLNLKQPKGSDHFWAAVLSPGKRITYCQNITAEQH